MKGTIQADITNCTFRMGTARYGGAIYISTEGQSAVSVRDSSFLYNLAEFSGGAVYAVAKDLALEMDSVVFTGNSAKVYGDTIFIKQNSTQASSTRRLE